MREELAWPLSLFAGFAGTWAGLSTGVPGLAALLATACISALVVGLSNRGRRMRAFACALGGVVGVAGAVLGSTFEGESQVLFRALPGAGLARTELARLFAGSALEPLAGALLHLVPVVAGLALARVTMGVGPVLAATLGVGATSAAVAENAVEFGVAGGHRLLAVVLGWPPGALAEVVGLLALGVAWAGPRGSLPPRSLVVGGWIALGLAALAWAGALPWAAAVGPTIGQS